MSDDVTITVRVNNQTAAGMRDVNGQLRTLDGRFAAMGNNVRRSSSMMERGMVDLRATMLSLAPAAVPVAASLAPIAVHAGAAGLAVAAFGAAVVPQIGNLKDAAGAQDKYTQAVTKYGQYSQQAIKAQAFVADTLKGMPQATQRAAAGYSNLRDQFHSFSDSTAKFTMVPVEHSFAVLGQVIPKLTPMVQSSATQLDRLMTVAGGAVNSSGFDALSKKVSNFANQSLKNATDGAIHFIRVMSEGNASGPMQEFFAYARAQGPAVKELLSNLMQALGNIAQGAAQAGPGMLSLVNALAKMVSAVPPEVIGRLMQVYAAFKLMTLAGAGIGAVAGGIQSLGVKIAALRAASVAAGGGLAGLKAAFLSLGTAAKASVIVAGIAALVLVVSKLSNIGKSAPPDVDRLTSSLARLGATGQVTGEAASKFGTHFEKLKSQMDKVLDPSVSESVNNWGHSISGGLLKGGDATEELTGSFKAIDESLADLVKGGKAKLAAVALKDMLKTMDPEQVKKLQGSLGKYKSALADQALEAKLTAQSMGLFGNAAQATQAKLDAQKASADGLRQSIQALNDVNRQGLGGMIGFEASIDAASKAARDNAGALSMTNGVLNLGSEKARNAASALQDLADKTDGAAASARESGSSWDTVNGIYSRGRKALIDSAEAMGLSKTEAQALAAQILKIPADKATKFKMEKEDAQHDIEAFNAAVKASPNSKSVTLKALSKSGEQVLESFGLKVKRLPDGSVTVSTKGGALAAINNIAAALRRLNGKSATTWTYHNVKTTYSAAGSVSGGKSVHGMVGATGGLYTGKGSGFRYADGGPVRGPGTGTSDDVPAPWLSNGEFVIKAAAVQKYGEHFLQRLNDGQFDGPHYAKGGKVKLTAAQQAERSARSQLSGEFGISSFGRMAGYQRTPFEHGLAAPTDVNALVSALNDAAGKIRAAFSGKTESNLLKHLNNVGKALIGQEKQLGKVTASLATAKTKLDDLKNSASQMAAGVKSGLMSSANITTGAAGSTVTVASIMGGLSQSRDKTVAFADALKGLKAKGLDKGLLQQIAEAGVGGGGLETAGALMGASSSEISSLNSLQSQVASAATSAGKTTADAYYGAAIKAQDKLVKSLAGQQSKLEKSMNRLASTMEKFIAKALGKKAAGGIVGAAASGGIRGGLTLVGEQGMELADLPVGSRVWSNPDTRRMLAATQAPWASMLNTPRGGASAAAGGASVAAAREPVVIELRSSGSDVDDFLLKLLRRAIRNRGGNVNVVLTGRP